MLIAIILILLSIIITITITCIIISKRTKNKKICDLAYFLHKKNIDLEKVTEARLNKLLSNSPEFSKTYRKYPNEVKEKLEIIPKEIEMQRISNINQMNSSINQLQNQLYILKEKYDNEREEKEPEQLLRKYKPKKHKKQSSSSMLGKAFNFICDTIDGGETEAEEAEENYLNMKRVFSIYFMRFEIFKTDLDCARLKYEISIENANLLASKIKNLTNKINPKERKSLFDLKIKKEPEYSISDDVITNEISEIDSNLNASKHVAGKSFERLLKSGNEMEFGINAAFSAITGIAYLAERSEANEKKTKAYNDANLKIQENIKTIEENRALVSSYTQRAIELSNEINTALDAYSKSYEIVYNTIFPAGDPTKTAEARKLRSDGFYTKEEKDLIFGKLYEVMKYLMTITDAKF